MNLLEDSLLKRLYILTETVRVALLETDRAETLIEVSDDDYDTLARVAERLSRKC